MNLIPRCTVLAVAFACLTAAPAPASPDAQPAFFRTSSSEAYLDVVQTLIEDGYVVTGLSTTLLGRIKIRAENAKHIREIVVSRSTGEILSDRVIHTREPARSGAAFPGSPTANRQAARAAGHVQEALVFVGSSG